MNIDTMHPLPCVLLNNNTGLFVLIYPMEKVLCNELACEILQYMYYSRWEAVSAIFCI